MVFSIIATLPSEKIAGALALNGGAVIALFVALAVADSPPKPESSIKGVLIELFAVWAFVVGGLVGLREVRLRRFIALAYELSARKR